MFAPLAVLLLLALSVEGKPKSKAVDLRTLMDHKIVGGHETEIARYPFMVAIDILQRNAWILNCGGTVLNEWHVLAAAHCVREDTNPAHSRIRVGSSSHASGGEVHEVAALHKPAANDAGTEDYDVGVYRLTRALVFSKVVQPVRLPPLSARPKDGAALQVVGWGWVAEYGPKSMELQDKLRQTTLFVVPQAKCVEAYKEAPRQVTDRMICAAAKGKDACTGDSGGPLIDPKTRTQYGVVSWGNGCALHDYPGVYTDLSHREIRKFIDGVLNLKH